MNGASLDGVAMYSLELHGRRFELSEHFRLEEFASGDGLDQVLVHPLLVQGLEELRAWCGGPLTINSGFRSVRHNAAIGGADRSKHKLGMAADIVSVTRSPNDVATWAEDRGFGGVGRYGTFTHLDVFGHSRRWDYR